MNLPVKIAWRYFWSRRKGGGFNAISIISAISLLGYVVSAAALLIVLSVFNGFENMFGGLFSNFDPDIQITLNEGKTFPITDLPVEKIKQVQGVEHANMVLEENIMLRYNNRQTIATAKAVDTSYLRASHLDTNITRGEVLLMQQDTYYALVGVGLAYQLGVDPADQFSHLGIYTPRKGEIDMLNPEGAFNHKVLMPAGIFMIQEEVDNSYIIIPLSFLSSMLEKEKEISALEIRLQSGADATAIQEKLDELCGKKFKVKNRYEQRESFYKIVKSEKLISYLILVFIALIAAFNTIGSLYMLVLEKKKDLKIFSSMGINKKQAAAVFIAESFFIAFAGTAAGILLGIGVCAGQLRYGWFKLNASSFFEQDFPVSLKTGDAVLVFFTLMLLGLLTSIYPARKASQMVR